ncbi:hypothetical protein P3C29_31790, partial [Pseudomonas sp. 1912-s]|nr:hypothetical protein [Pseudomonas sp. 1912-s]
VELVFGNINSDERRVMVHSVFPHVQPCRIGLCAQATVRTSLGRNLLRPMLTHDLEIRGHYGLKQVKTILQGHTEPRRGAEWWGKSVLLTFALFKSEPL